MRTAYCVVRVPFSSIRPTNHALRNNDQEIFMANLSLFWNGFVIGLSIAAPVGPIGVLCIQRTLNQGRAIGFASGIGAATADASIGSIAALGLTVVSKFLADQQ